MTRLHFAIAWEGRRSDPRPRPLRRVLELGIRLGGWHFAFIPISRWRVRTPA